MNLFSREKELLREYFKITPILLIILDLGFPIFSFWGSIYGFLNENTGVLLFFILAITAFFTIKIYRIKRTHVNLRNLYLNNDTFLSHMIMNITEVKRLREKEKINNVKVISLDVHFNIINSPNNNNKESDMDVLWNVRCKTLNNELLNYHILCSKSDSRRKYNPIIEVKEFDKNYVANVNNMSNDLFNHLSVVFINGRLQKNTDFSVKIDLRNYYKFMWTDCEVLFINTSMFGTTIENLNLKLTFKDARIKDKNISVYEVDKNNFNRILIQQSTCQINNGVYEYSFNSNKASDKFFLIAIPKSF